MSREVSRASSGNFYATFERNIVAVLVVDDTLERRDTTVFQEPALTKLCIEYTYGFFFSWISKAYTFLQLHSPQA